MLTRTCEADPGERGDPVSGWMHRAPEPRLLAIGEAGPVYWFDEQSLLLTTRSGLGCLGCSCLEELPSFRLRDLVHRDDLGSALEGFLRPRRADPVSPAVLHLVGGSSRVCEVYAEWVEFGTQRLLICYAAEREPLPRWAASQAHLARLATLGMVTAGVVHEVNNPVAYVLLSLDQLAQQVRQLGADERATSILLGRIGETREEVRRIATIARDVRLLARGDGSSLGTVDVRQVLEGAVRVTGHELRRRARLVVAMHGSPLVRASATQLEQVFINLLVNAAQAMPRSSTDGQVRVMLRSEPPLVVVEISDNGGGIAAEDLPRIFDPFFTTKADGLGTGLGLSIARNIVTSLGGRIGVSSSDGRGCTFRVELPVYEPLPPSKADSVA